jgi:hypothetical protein
MSVRSVSKPVTTSSRMTPIQPTVNSIPDCTAPGGKIQSNTPGAMRPRIDGPSTIPAASSPTTDG